MSSRGVARSADSLHDPLCGMHPVMTGHHVETTMYPGDARIAGLARAVTDDSSFELNATPETFP